MTIKPLLIGALLLILNPLAVAHDGSQDKALTIDKAVAAELEFQFPNEDNIRPDRSDFKVINFVTMSNGRGERKAAVTLTNQASGSRIFDNEQIMALFANGDRQLPAASRISFRARETKTISLDFGRHQYPILDIYTRE